LDCKLKKLIQEILDLGLCGLFPSVTIARLVFVSSPAPVAFGERTFNMLQQVKGYYHSVMDQYRLFAKLNCDLAQE
jgi:hypothetical protein